MRDLGLPVYPEYQRVVSLSDDDAAYHLTRDLMALPEPPTALFALTGNQGIEAYRALRDAGLRVPTDVSLITFDNYPWTSLVDPQIDVIDQPTDEMALTAVEAIVDAIERDSTATVRKRLPATLIRRGSCAPPTRP
jgi:LacI family transcriptional regulator